MHAPKQGEEGTKHYVVPNGMSNLVKHFFKKSGVTVQSNRRISEVTEEGSRWVVKTECGLTDMFDMVLLTLPVPQLLALEGSVQSLLQASPDVLANLQKVSYSTRFVSVDNLKRGRSDLPTSVLVHSTVPFGLKNIQATPEEMKPVLLNGVKKMFPDWPEPEDVKSLKWLYSQVHHAYPDAPGSIILNQIPLMIAGGDAFTSSNFDGCVDSAVSILNRVLRCYEKK